jgi:hypothetical protein
MRSGHVKRCGCDFDRTAFDAQGFSVDQGIGDLLVSRFEDSAERLSRDTHFLRGVGLIQSLKIGQPDRLELIDG